MSIKIIYLLKSNISERMLVRISKEHLFITIVISERAPSFKSEPPVILSKRKQNISTEKSQLLITVACVYWKFLQHQFFSVALEICLNTEAKFIWNLNFNSILLSVQAKIHGQPFDYIKTSQLVCFVNQLTELYATQLTNALITSDMDTKTMTRICIDVSNMTTWHFHCQIWKWID